MSGHHTDENDYGCYWPTPRAQGSTTFSFGTPTLEMAVKLWPTPTVQDRENDGGASQNNRIPLNLAVKQHGGTSTRQTYPTPSASMMTEADMEQSRFAGDNPNRPTYREAKKYPTPVKADNHGHKQPGTLPGELGIQGGQLSPDWVEWLMNFPIGATSLQPLSVERFHAWLRMSRTGVID
jgi:hypothetical protein